MMSIIGRSKKLQVVTDNIREYPDFPKPGILFRDVFAILSNPNAMKYLFELLTEEVNKAGKIDVIVGLEARGFLLGVQVANTLGIPFVPIRKKGKLPGKVKEVSFSLEYGTDIFEIQENCIRPNQRVVLIDDLIATGGSLAAGCQLVTEMGGKVVQCLVVIELADLKGRCNVPTEVNALVSY